MAHGTLAKLYRQGDILLRKIDRLPENMTAIPGDILAEGEATGHHHRLSGQAQIYETEGSARVIEVSGKTAMLVHEEHKPIEIENGIYAVVREREFNPFDESERAVMD